MKKRRTKHKHTQIKTATYTYKNSKEKKQENNSRETRNPYIHIKQYNNKNARNVKLMLVITFQ